MYPNLYYVFKDLFGVELSGLKLVNSFGFFVAIAFIICAWVLYARITGENNSKACSFIQKKPSLLVPKQAYQNY